MVETKVDVSAEDRMLRIPKLIADLQGVHDRWGDTCVYVRRGGLSWGAVALNYRGDDEKHGVFDLQAAHDRERERHAGQVERLIAHRNELFADRDSLAAKLAEAEQSRDEWTSIAVERGLEKEDLRANLTAAQATIAQLRAENESDAVKAAVEAEREACAKIAETGLNCAAWNDGGEGFFAFTEALAELIRARSSAPPVNGDGK